MQKYFEERKASNYEPPEFMGDAGGLSNITALKQSSQVRDVADVFIVDNA